MTGHRRPSTAGWIALAGFGALAGLAVFLSVTPPADGYEISMYEALPLPFWVLAGFGLFAGQWLVVRRVFRPGDGTGRWTYYGVLLVASIEVVLLALPYLRGYPVFGRADVLTHVGHVQSIHDFGAVGADNIYPSFHLLVLALSYATGVDPMHVINAVPVVVTALSILASYALVSALFDRRRALLTFPLLTLFIGGSAHTNASPYAQTALLVPFVLYLFVREQRAPTVTNRALLAFVLIAMVFYHPLTTLFLVVIFLAYSVSRFVLSLDAVGSDPGHRRGPATSTAGFQLTLAVFLSWYYQFESVLTRFASVLRRLFGTDAGQSQLRQFSSTISETSPALVDVVVIALVKVGQSALLITLGGLYVLKLGYERLTRRVGPDPYQLTLAVSLGLFCGMAVLGLVFDLVVGFGRPLVFARIVGALLAGSLLYHLVRRFSAGPAVRTAVAVVLVALVAVGIAGLYLSPIEARSNQQVTETELSGSEWLLEHREPTTGVDQYIMDLWRFRDAHYGTRGWSNQQLVSASGTSPPAHFNYDEGSRLGATYDGDSYLVVTRLGRDFYPETYPDYEAQWRFTPGDFDELDRDPTVSRVYDNGGLDVYLVSGAG